MAKNAKKMSLVPLGDKVLIRAKDSEAEKTASGIIIPDSAKQKDKQQGTVIAVGRGTINTNGQLIAPAVKVNDHVLFNANDWDKQEINGEELYLVSESSILGIIK